MRNKKIIELGEKKHNGSISKKQIKNLKMLKNSTSQNRQKNWHRKKPSESNFKIASYRFISEANSNKKLPFPDEFSDKNFPD